MRLVGIDPGRQGAIAVREPDGEVACYRLDVAPAHLWLAVAELDPAVVAVEKAVCGPSMSRRNSFTVGYHYGMLLGMLRAAGLRVREVQSRRWQADLGLVVRGSSYGFGDGRQTKVYRSKKIANRDLARRLYPELKVVHWNADALLVLEWLARRLTEEISA